MRIGAVSNGCGCRRASWRRPLAAPTRAVLDARPGRDLAVAAPESVGVSTERLKRLDAGMKGLVDDGKLAGIVTMLVAPRQDGALHRARRRRTSARPTR